FRAAGLRRARKGTSSASPLGIASTAGFDRYRAQSHRLGPGGVLQKFVNFLLAPLAVRLRHPEIFFSSPEPDQTACKENAKQTSHKSAPPARRGQSAHRSSFIGHRSLSNILRALRASVVKRRDRFEGLRVFHLREIA